MKKQEKQDWRAKSIKALSLEIAKKEKELLLAKMKLARGQLKNVRQPRQLRHAIAVLKTLRHEKELAAARKEKK